MCSVLSPPPSPENQKKVELDTISRRRKEISGNRTFRPFSVSSVSGDFPYLFGGQISLLLKTILSPFNLSVLCLSHALFLFSLFVFIYSLSTSQSGLNKLHYSRSTSKIGLNKFILIDRPPRSSQ